jgi:hypothetical protein
MLSFSLSHSSCQELLWEGGGGASSPGVGKTKIFEMEIIYFLPSKCFMLLRPIKEIAIKIVMLLNITICASGGHCD